MDQFGKLLEAKDTEGLVALLVADERHLRIAAAGALGQLADQNTVPDLVGAMGDEEVPVRRAAARALARIGQPAIPALITALAGTGGRLAPYAIWALGEIASPLAVDALIEATVSEEWRVRWGAVQALAEVGGEASIDALLDALGDGDLRVVKAASEALERLGEASVEGLALALRNPDKAVRAAARRTLVKIDTPDAQAHLRRERLFLWIPVLAIMIGALLVITWVVSMIV